MNAELSDRISQLEMRLDGIESMFEGFAARLAEIDSGQGVLDRLDGTLSELRGEITDLDSRLWELDSRTGGLDSQLDTLRESTTSLAAKQDTVNDDIRTGFEAVMERDWELARILLALHRKLGRGESFVQLVETTLLDNADLANYTAEMESELRRCALAYGAGEPWHRNTFLNVYHILFPELSRELDL